MPIKLKSSGGGDVTLDVPSTASTFTVTVPASTGTLINTAPGTSGNVLTSNGTTWASTAPATGTTTTLGTPTASTSGTAITYTGIPSTAKRIVMMWSLVQTSGSADKLMRLGTAGGIVSTGYSGAGGTNGSAINQTTGFVQYSRGSTNVLSGAIELELLDATNNIWVAFGAIGLSDAPNFNVTAGRVALSGPLTQVQFTTTNGTDTFTAGSVNILYQS